MKRSKHPINERGASDVPQGAQPRDTDDVIAGDTGPGYGAQHGGGRGQGRRLVDMQPREEIDPRGFRPAPVSPDASAGGGSMAMEGPPNMRTHPLRNRATEVHVLPTEGGWTTRFDPTGEILDVTLSREEALEEARELAEQYGLDLVVHQEDGTVEKV